MVCGGGWRGIGLHTVFIGNSNCAVCYFISCIVYVRTYIKCTLYKCVMFVDKMNDLYMQNSNLKSVNNMFVNRSFANPSSHTLYR